MKVRDWRRAESALKRTEERNDVAAPSTVANAKAEYLRDCAARGCADSTLKSYGILLNHLEAFCESGRDLGEISEQLTTQFINGRTVQPSTRRKELQTLRGFFSFCLRNRWCDRNPALSLKHPKEQTAPTMPYSRDEVRELLAACDRAISHIRARAIVLLLLYTGLRISDAVHAKRSAIDASGRITLKIMKTGVPLTLQLPAEVTDALAILPNSGEYFFRSDVCRKKTAIGNVSTFISKLGKAAGIKATPHRFRDTFAVELLLAGEDIRRVQLLLGHTSIKTTEKHYAPFVRGFQKQLDESIAKLNFLT
jgi:site-specific recombinase XerD